MTMGRPWQALVTLPLLSLAIATVFGALYSDDWTFRWHSCSRGESSPENDTSGTRQQLLVVEDDTSSSLFDECTEELLSFNIWTMNRDTAHHLFLPLFLIAIVCMSFSVLFNTFGIACAVITRLRSKLVMDKWSCRQFACTMLSGFFLFSSVVLYGVHFQKELNESFQISETMHSTVIRIGKSFVLLLSSVTFVILANICLLLLSFGPGIRSKLVRYFAENVNEA